MQLFKGVRGYRQLVHSIRTAVQDGTLLPGARLPSQRQLAHKLGLAVGTDPRAYQEAEQAGLIPSYIGRGTFVTHPGTWLTAAKASTASPDIVNLTIDEPLEAFAPDISDIALDLLKSSSINSLLQYNNAAIAA